MENIEIAYRVKPLNDMTFFPLSVAVFMFSTVSLVISSVFQCLFLLKLAGCDMILKKENYPTTQEICRER